MNQEKLIAALKALGIPGHAISLDFPQGIFIDFRDLEGIPETDASRAIFANADMGDKGFFFPC